MPFKNLKVQREYYKRNKKRLQAQHEKWRKKSKKKIAKRNRRRYKRDSKYRRARLKSWRKWVAKKLRTDPKFRKLRWLSQIKMKYGLTPDDLKIILKKQKYKCLLCSKIRKLVIDHDHKTGKVRGLLCRKCNMWLSWFDNKKQFKKVLKYVQGKLK